MDLNFHTTAPHVALKLQWQDEHTDTVCLSTVRQDECVPTYCGEEEQKGVNDKENWHLWTFRDKRNSAERRHYKQPCSLK